MAVPGLVTATPAATLARRDGVGERFADRERRRDRGDDRVAGTGHVEDAMGLGGHVEGRLAALDQRHAGGAAGDQDGADRDLGKHRPAGRLSRLVALGADARELRHLLDIGREQGGAGKDRRVGLLRIDDYRHAGLVCRGDQGLDGARVEDALGVVGEDDDLGLGQRLGSIRDDLGGDRLGHGVDILGIDAEQLVPAGEEPRLHGGRAVLVLDQQGAKLREPSAERGKVGRRLVRTGDADQTYAGAVGDEVRGDVAGAAEEGPVIAVLQHRHRRLRRDAPDVALDEAVDENVADHEHACLCEAIDDGSIHCVEPAPENP